MHSSRFNKPGDYFKLEIAGFPFILIMGKDGVINGFHNVCRHRAYPIVKKVSGSSTVLGNTAPPYVLAIPNQKG
jgi:phenylpropionate dioxygenase-like ring-hydroxylating dioxygenase large terminal subunit